MKYSCNNSGFCFLWGFLCSSGVSLYCQQKGPLGIHRMKKIFSLTSLFLLIQETQTELVMFILLRLAEDVVTFQTLPPQRRRDIQQTLTQNMEKIFSFLLNTLQENVNKYREVVRDAPPPQSSIF